MTVGVSTTAALRAYRLGNELPVAREPMAPAAKGPSFAELLEKTATNAIETIHNGDRMAVAGLRGEVSTQEVVEATMAMETTMKTVVAVRDKVVSAYQEILRMTV